MSMVTTRIVNIGLSGLALVLALVASGCSSEPSQSSSVDQPNKPVVSQENKPTAPTTAEPTGFATQSDAKKWESENVGKSFTFTANRENDNVNLAFSKASVPDSVTLKHFKIEFLQNGTPVQFMRDGKLVLKAFSQRDKTQVNLDPNKLDASPLTARVTAVWQVTYGAESEEWKDPKESTLN